MKHGLVIIIMVLFGGIVSSQDINFKHFTSEEGLPSNTIVSIFQDSEDFMWFGTDYGISRFDGYGFLNFQHTVDDSLSLSHNFVLCMVEDYDRNIWIGTAEGLNKFNRNNFIIEPIKGFEKLHISSILQIQKEILLIGTHGSGVIKLNTKSGDMERLTQSDESTSISSNVVNCLVDDARHGIIVGTKNGLDIYTPDTDQFDHILQSKDVIQVKYFSDSSIFISTSNPGYYYRWEHQSPKIIELPSAYANTNILSMVDTKSGCWIGFNSEGVFHRDKNTGGQYHLLYNRYKSEGLSSNVITSLYKDKWENVWIGTFDGGANFFEGKGNKFIHIRDNYLPNGLRNNRVRSIYQDSQGDIWVGTKGNGTLSRFDRKTSEFEHYLTQSSSREPDNYILCITENRPGQLWVGTYNGLYLFNKGSGSYEIINRINDDQVIRSKRIYALLKDSDVLYVGHQSLGLDIYNIKHQSLKNFYPTDDSTSISSGKVRVIYKDSKQCIWIGTAGGLNKFDPETNTFQRFLEHPGDTTRLSDNLVLSISEDASKNLWIGTQYGLNLLNRKRNTFQTYTTKDGLPDNTINAIYPDDKGNLWLSTHNGISKFNPTTAVVRNYNTSDGISTNELVPFAHCKTAEGEILFGSNKGMTLFDPKEIVDNENVPKVVLTNFKIANKDVHINDSGSPLKKHISMCQDLTLTHKQTFISFEYVALNYASTEKNQYAYTMEGLEDDWNYVGNKREAVYTNLRHGRYTFRVKASNNDGLWNEDGVSVNIHVLPPPWLSWWAYIIYTGILVFIILFYRNYTIGRVKVEQALKQNQEKLHFFLNVSHEFRTPITLLLLPLQRILKSNDLTKIKAAAEEANTSANKLMNLTNQLLDYRKTDVGHLPLRAQKLNIVEFSRELFKPFLELGKVNGIRMTFDALQPEIIVWIDPDKYEKILNNLLSNAIKFTNSGGCVSLKFGLNVGTPNVGLFSRKVRDFVTIKVTDTGQGISIKRINHLFDRFYSEDKSTAGTGIGLHYTKNLVELHGGDIKAESKLNEGSTFTVTFPLGDAHLNESEKRKEIFRSKDYMHDKNMLQALRYDLKSKNIDAQHEQDLREQKDKQSSKLPFVLIVEDNKQLRQQLKQELSRQFRIKVAENGLDGWEKIKKYTPDLVLSDIMMPIMDGIALCNRIKNDDDICHIPVILLTAKGSVEHQVEGYEIGADAYIQKPFHIDVLQSRIQNILDARKRLREKFLTSGNAISSKAIATNNKEELFLDKLTQLILNNISDEDYGLADIQKEMNISRTNLYLKVNKLTGINPSIFVRSVKLKYAAELLSQEKYSIKEICHLSGFKNASHFNQLFKETYHQTPLQYRKGKGQKTT